jgi:hypothetical protein
MDISWFGLVNGQTLSCDVNAELFLNVLLILFQETWYISRGQRRKYLRLPTQSLPMCLTDGNYWLCRLLAVTTAGDVHVLQI